jgi:beta-glucosidase
VFKFTFKFTCTITNTGTREGDEVIQVYHKAGDDIRAKATHPVPLKQLVDFERVRLAKGASTTVEFSVPAHRLALTNNDGDYALYAGNHSIIFSRGHGDDVEVSVAVNTTEVHKNLHPAA